MKRVVLAAMDAPVTAARWYIRPVSEMRPAMGACFRSSLNEDRDAPTDSVVHESSRGRVDMVFHTSNEVCRYRATTFSTRERETLEWTEEFGGQEASYNIGASVGFYTRYHAKLFPTRVYAFESSVLNLELLARNITLNAVTDRTVVAAIPLASPTPSLRARRGRRILRRSCRGGHRPAHAGRPAPEGEAARTHVRLRRVRAHLQPGLGLGLIRWRPRG